jgi:hypothetical protein
MRRNLIAALALTFCVVAFASPALGQGYQSAVGWSGGVFFNTALNDGATGSIDFVEMKADPTWVLNVNYDYWLGGGNLGIRANGGFSKPILPWVQGDREIRVYMADLGVILRPIAAGPDRSVLPFIGGGVGFMNWGLGDGPPTDYDPAGVRYGGEQSFDLIASAGAGLDFVTPWEWGEGPMVIRLEGRDYLQFSSPFDPIDSAAEDFGLIHNIVVMLGFHTGMGVLPGG